MELKSVRGLSETVARRTGDCHQDILDNDNVQDVICDIGIRHC
jgi:hypothetical protein